jgi:hypothetical protein
VDDGAPFEVRLVRARTLRTRNHRRHLGYLLVPQTRYEHPHCEGNGRCANRLELRWCTVGVKGGRERAWPPSLFFVFTCKLRISESGPAWTRTRNLFLIREAQHFAGGFQNLQNPCKYTYSRANAFPEFSGYLLGLLHSCCTIAVLFLLQRFAMKLNRHIVSTPAFAQEVFSEEKHAATVGVAQQQCKLL